MKKIWDIWAYIWRVTINFVTVIIVIAIFTSANSKFESLVITFLVLIYFSITSFYSHYCFITVERGFALYEEFARIRKLLNEGELEEAQEALEIEKKKFRTATIKFWINAFFAVILYLICIFNMFRALNS